jgi:ADP-heptose:LPS heptosyltransferase
MERLGGILGDAPCRVAVFRALQLGDVLCAIPALRALRRARPAAVITLIGLPWAVGLLPRFRAYLDEVLPFPGYPGLPEQPPALGELPAFLAAVQARRFDFALQLHGAGVVTNPLVAAFGAGRLAGFFRPGEFCPDPATFLPYPDGGHEIHRLLRLVEFLGLPADGDRLEFPLLPADHRALAAIPELAALRGGAYACVHPGARARTKCWPVERFAAVADFLQATGLEVVLTGADRETELTAAVRGAMRGRAVDAAHHDLPLGPLAALLAGARLLVSNDTGVSHLAAALRVRSVVIFSGSDPRRWAPLDRRRHTTLQAPGGVSVGDAVAAAARALGLAPPRRPGAAHRQARRVA